MLTAGIDAASADAVIAIDVDLRDPPELIPLFVFEWHKGYKVVFGRRRINRSEDLWLRRATSWVFYLSFNSISRSNIPLNAGDFRLIDRPIINALKGSFSAVGFKTMHIDYKRPARKVGKTKWNYWKLWNFALDGPGNVKSKNERLRDNKNGVRETEAGYKQAQIGPRT